jgi:acyl-CoA hydrolase
MLEEEERANVCLSASRMVPTALANHVEKNNLQGKLKYSLFVGASSGAETENRWARLNMIERRSPHQVGKDIAKGINNGNIKFFDKHLSMFPSDLVYVSLPSFFFFFLLLGDTNCVGMVYERSTAQQAGRDRRRGDCHH